MNLKIFDKDGYLYNFSTSDLGDNDIAYVSELFFDPNSSETYKTLGLYLLEEVPGFEVNGNYFLNRLQSHNKFRFLDFKKSNGHLDISNNSSDINYGYILSTNSLDSWYTKWIYSKNIGLKFPKNSWIHFEFPTYEEDYNRGILHPNPTTANSPIPSASEQSFWILADLLPLSTDIFKYQDDPNYPDFLNHASETKPGTLDCYKIKPFRVLKSEKDRILIDTRYNPEWFMTLNGWSKVKFNGVSNNSYPANTHVYSKFTTTSTEMYKIGLTCRISSLNMIAADSTELDNGMPDKLWSCENWFKEKCLQVHNTTSNSKCFNIIENSKTSWYKLIKFPLWSKMTKNQTLWKIFREAAYNLKNFNTTIEVKFYINLNTDSINDNYVWSRILTDNFWDNINDFYKWLDSTLIPQDIEYTKLEQKNFDINDKGLLDILLPLETTALSLSNNEWFDQNTWLKIINKQSPYTEGYPGYGIPENFDINNKTQPYYPEVIEFLKSFTYFTKNGIVIKNFFVNVEDETVNLEATFNEKSIQLIPVIQNVKNEINKNKFLGFDQKNPLSIWISKIDSDKNILNIKINDISYSINVINENIPYHPNSSLVKTINEWIFLYEEKLEKVGVRVKSLIEEDIVFPDISADPDLPHEYSDYPGTWVGAKNNNYIIIEYGEPVLREPILISEAKCVLNFWSIVEDILLDVSIDVGDNGEFKVKNAEIWFDRYNGSEWSLSTNDSSGTSVKLSGDVIKIITPGEGENDWLNTGLTINSWIKKNLTLDFPVFPFPAVNNLKWTITGSGPYTLTIITGNYLLDGIIFNISNKIYTIPITTQSRIDSLFGNEFGELTYVQGYPNSSPIAPTYTGKKILDIRVYDSLSSKAPQVQSVITQEDNFLVKLNSISNKPWYPYSIPVAFTWTLLDTSIYKINLGTLKWKYNNVIFPLNNETFTLNNRDNTYDRIDSIFGASNGTLVYVAGIADSIPVAPTLTNYVKLLDIYVYSTISFLHPNIVFNNLVINIQNGNSSKLYGPYNLTINTGKYFFDYNEKTISNTSFDLLTPSNTENRIEFISGDQNGNIFYNTTVDSDKNSLIKIINYSTIPNINILKPNYNSPWVTPFLKGFVYDLWFEHKWIEPKDPTLGILPITTPGQNVLEVWSMNKMGAVFSINTDIGSNYNIKILNDQNVGSFVSSNQIDIINIDNEIFAEFNLNYMSFDVEASLKIELSGTPELNTIISNQHLISEDPSDTWRPKVKVNIVPSNMPLDTLMNAKFKSEILVPFNAVVIDQNLSNYSRTLKHSFYVNLSGGFSNGDINNESSPLPSLNTYDGIFFEFEDVESAISASDTIPDIFSNDSVYYLDRTFHSENLNNLTVVKLSGFIKYKKNHLDFEYTTQTSSYNIGIVTPFSENEFSPGNLITLSGSLYPTNNDNYNITNIIDSYNVNGQFIGSKLVLNYQGSFIPDYDDIRIVVESSFRYPKYGKSNEPTLKYRFRWETQEIVDESIFLYDFSGLNIKPNNNIIYGNVDEAEKSNHFPLWQPVLECDDDIKIFLNKTANNDPTKTLEPQYQQTVFNNLEFNLLKLDQPELADNNSCCSSITPIQVFVGYNSYNEGVNNRTLIIEEILDFTFTFTRTLVGSSYEYYILVNNINLENYLISQYENSYLDSFFIEREIDHIKNTFNQKVRDSQGNLIPIDKSKFTVRFHENKITIDSQVLDFKKIGLKAGYYVLITGRDITNEKFKVNIKNSSTIAKIVEVNSKYITLNTQLIDESNEFIAQTNWDSITNTWNQSLTWVEIEIKLLPKILGQIKFWGETEIEDERYKTWTENLGLNINPKDIQIFQNYDINENGIDWIFMNKKRKELLYTHSSIFNYISAYKSITNSINFFGWSSLELNEYYKNINPESELYNTLHKIVVPDFSKLESTDKRDYLFYKYPNASYVKTDLLNLTYHYTDENGNFINVWPIEVTVKKLQKLKRWLRDNVLTLTTRVRDITIEGTHKTIPSIQHSHSRIITNANTNNELFFINFIPTAYVLGINSNVSTFRQDILNIHIEFTALEIFDPYTLNINTFREYSEKEINDLKIKQLNINVYEWFKNLDYLSLPLSLKIPDISLNISDNFKNNNNNIDLTVKQYSLNINGTHYNYQGIVLNMINTFNNLNIVNTYVNNNLNPSIMNYDELKNKVNPSKQTILFIDNSFSFPIVIEKVKIETISNINYITSDINGNFNLIIFDNRLYIFDITNSSLKTNHENLKVIIDSWNLWKSNMENYIFQKRSEEDIILTSNYVEELQDSLLPVQNISIFKNDLESYNFAVNRSLDPFFEINIKSHDGRGSGLSLRRTYQVKVEGTEKDGCQCIEVKKNRYVLPKELQDLIGIKIPILEVKNTNCFDSSEGSILIGLIENNFNYPYQLVITKSGGAYDSVPLVELLNPSTNIFTTYPNYSVNSNQLVINKHINDQYLFISNLKGSKYTIEIFDSTGLSGIKELWISQPGDLQITIDYHNVSCFGSNDAHIQIINLTNSCGDEVINWYKHDTNNFILMNPQPSNPLLLDNITSGTYKILASYCGTCSKESDQFTINEPSQILTTIINSETLFTSIDCYGENNGYLKFNLAGGSTFSDTTNLYDITITWDNWPLSFNPPVNLNDPLFPTNLTSDELTDYINYFNQSKHTNYLNSLKSSILNQLSINSSLPIYLNELYSGDYTFIIKDKNGCTTTLNYTYSENVIIDALSFEVKELICANSSDSEIIINIINNVNLDWTLKKIDDNLIIDQDTINSSIVYQDIRFPNLPTTLNSGTYEILFSYNTCEFTFGPIIIKESPTITSTLNIVNITSNNNIYEIMLSIFIVGEFDELNVLSGDSPLNINDCNNLLNIDYCITQIDSMTWLISNILYTEGSNIHLETIKHSTNCTVELNILAPSKLEIISYISNNFND